MMKRLFTRRNLIVLALTAVVSLTVGHLIDLGTQTLGSGPTSTLAVIGDLAGLVGCAASAWFGVRGLRRSRLC